GMATRYLPELVDAAEDTVGFLATFKGSARQEALDNLTSIDDQLTVLGEGLERIEHDVVAGVSHSLEVHSEFLRTRFAEDRKSTRLNSSHVSISYAVFCLKKKNKKYTIVISNKQTHQ